MHLKLAPPPFYLPFETNPPSTCHLKLPPFYLPFETIQLTITWHLNYPTHFYLPFVTIQPPSICHLKLSNPLLPAIWNYPTHFYLPFETIQPTSTWHLKLFNPLVPAIFSSCSSKHNCSKTCLVLILPKRYILSDIKQIFFTKQETFNVSLYYFK